MFREMRRKKQALDRTEIDRILHYGTNGVLALSGTKSIPMQCPSAMCRMGMCCIFTVQEAGTSWT